MSETVVCTFTNTKDGRIIVKKVVNPASDPTTFSFTGDLQGPIGHNQTIEANVAPGQYQTTEAPGDPDFDLLSIDCDDANSTEDLPNRKATYNVEAGETVTCTFTNRKKGRIIVKKIVDPASDLTEFSFTGDLQGQIGHNETIELQVSPGQYQTTETADPDFDLLDIDCDDANSVEDEPNRTATYQVEPGETVTCTFTNRKKGRIIVKKLVDPASDPTEFSFTGDLQGQIGHNETIELQVSPGQYQTIETTDPDFDLLDIDCDDTNSVEDEPNRKAIYNVEPGETVTCTFTNTKKGRIIVKKIVDPASDPTEFTFTGDLQGQIGHNETIELQVSPGQYQTTETADPDFDLLDIDCDDANSTEDEPNRTATYNVEAGETVTCTFTNQRQGAIVCSRDGATLSVALPAGSQGAIVRSGTAISVSIDGNPVECGGPTVNNVDTVNVTGTIDTELLQLDLSGGAFAPGQTSEGAGSEIEFQVDLDGGAGPALAALLDANDAIVITGSGSADTIRLGTLGINLNGDADADVTLDSVTQATVDAGGGNDKVSGEGNLGTGSPFGIQLILNGGSGNDKLTGGTANDTVNGNEGKDTFYALKPADGADTFNGGPQADTGSYAKRTGTVTLTNNGAADDGSPGPPEGDNIAADVENLTGGKGGDTLTATTSGANTAKGGKGNDTIDVRDTIASNGDKADGGDGTDSCQTDTGDTKLNCEP